MIVMATEKDGIQFSSLFGPAEVICQTQETDRDKTLLDMVCLLARQHNIGSVEEAHEAVLVRENELATVVAPGLAMPHARLETIDEIVVAVATSKEGILYDSHKSDNRVKLIVLTLAPKAAPGAYLQTLSCLARICQDASTADVVAGLPTPEQVWEFFDQGGITHSDRPHGQDVMDPVQVNKLLRQ
ncbi:MAG: PTS sugar transporter subunit IIA [Phycisphaerae bacterium]|nr:PTS sugar transporter subunit IIA [Phycisphaerae bacterium]